MTSLHELLWSKGVPAALRQAVPLAIAAEREACALICDEYAKASLENDNTASAFDHAAKAIRNRGAK